MFQVVRSLLSGVTTYNTIKYTTNFLKHSKMHQIDDNDHARLWYSETAFTPRTQLLRRGGWRRGLVQRQARRPPPRRHVLRRGRELEPPDLRLRSEV